MLMADGQNYPKKVLLIDDDPLVRAFLTKRIGDAFRQRIEIYEAECGKDAIILLEAEKFDVVVSDMDMPNGNGVSVYAFLKLTSQNPYFFFFTGTAEVDLPALGDRYFGVIQKPNHQSIVEKMREFV